MEKEEIKGILDDLKSEQFKTLKWHLENFSKEDKTGGRIGGSRLENVAGSSQLVDLLVEHYTDRAVEVLVKLLRKVPRHDLADDLERGRIHQEARVSVPKKETYKEWKNEGTEGRSSFSRCNLDCYDMTKKRVAFMMCTTEDRAGAEKDIQIMTKWFDAFKFQTPLGQCENPSKDELMQELEIFQKKINRSNEDISCCLIILMSHGTDNGYILDKNGNKINLEEIFSLFNNKECPKLRKKPKIFIIQACRGEQKDSGVQADEPKELDEKINVKLPTASDYLIVYPCQKGSVALRDTKTGSVMISAMDRVFSEHGMQWHVVDLFTKVNSMIVSRDFDVGKNKDSVKVTLVMESTLTKAIYLAPN